MDDEPADTDDQVRGLANAMFEHVHGFVGALRRLGIGASQSEAIDAFRMLEFVEMQDRSVLCEALAATLVSSPRERQVFDELFDLWFPPHRGTATRVPADQELLDDDGQVDDDAMTRAIIDALLDGDDAALRAAARQAVDAWGRVDGRDGTPSWFGYRVRRHLDPRTLLDALLAARDAQDDSPLAQRLLRDEYEGRLGALNEQVDAEIRRRAADRLGVEHVARRSVPPALEELDFLRMRPGEAAELRAQIAPLARKLASRTQVRRSLGRDGRLDLRRTVRRSLGTGGVPFVPAYRPRRPHKPELFVLTDVSGSVASFARFTLLLVHALQEQFARVRSFAFIDNLDEVTSLLATRDITAGLARIATEANLVWLDGHSDYGRALTVFHDHHAGEVTARSTVLLLGDARNNYRAPATWVLQDLHRRARRVYWLNPEDRSHWGTGDSITHSYAPHVDEMVEVRNMRQLADFVATLT